MTWIDILNFLIKYIPIVGFYFMLILNAFLALHINTSCEEARAKQKQLTCKYSGYEEQNSRRHTKKRKHRRQLIHIKKNKG